MFYELGNYEFVKVQSQLNNYETSYYQAELNYTEKYIQKYFGGYQSLRDFYDFNCTYNSDSNHLFYVEMSCGIDTKYKDIVEDSAEPLSNVKGLISFSYK